MGRIVVITGGTSGIGLKLKECFEKAGDTVLTFSIDETGDNNHYCGSVDHEIKVKQVFNDIHERFGTIDILINCAGIGMSGVTELIPTEEIQRVMDINFLGTLYCVRSALPHMNRGAKIINMSSAMALFPVPFRSVYGSAKSAVLSLSFSLRMELAPLGIDVVAMCPGDTKTNFTKNKIKDLNTTERYGDRIKTATEKHLAKEDKRMSCEYVVSKIFKYINLKKTKPFYIIGGKYKFLYFLTRFTSKNCLLKSTAKLYGGKMVAEEKKIKKEKPVKEKTKAVVETSPTENVDDVKTSIENVAPAEVVNDVDSKVGAEGTAEATTTTEATTETPKPNGLNDILSKIKIVNKANDEESDNN